MTCKQLEFWPFLRFCRQERTHKDHACACCVLHSFALLGVLPLQMTINHKLSSLGIRENYHGHHYCGDDIGYLFIYLQCETFLFKKKEIY